MTTESIITLTPKAITKVQDILSKEQSETAMLRVLAMPSPGGSIQYMFAVEETSAENDQVFEFEKIKVLVDENSIDVLQGSEIDYIDSIMRSGFVISNPNNTGGCACGGDGGGGCGGGGGGCGVLQPRRLLLRSCDRRCRRRTLSRRRGCRGRGSGESGA